MNSYLVVGLGSFVGFLFFIYNVSLVGSVFFRQDSLGHQHFTLAGYNDYLLAPFCVGTIKFRTVWGLFRGISWRTRVSMLLLNWIVLTGVGGLIAYLLYSDQ